MSLLTDIAVVVTLVLLLAVFGLGLTLAWLEWCREPQEWRYGLLQDESGEAQQEKCRR